MPTSSYRGLPSTGYEGVSRDTAAAAAAAASAAFGAAASALGTASEAAPAASAVEAATAAAAAPAAACSAAAASASTWLKSSVSGKANLSRALALSKVCACATQQTTGKFVRAKTGLQCSPADGERRAPM